MQNKACCSTRERFSALRCAGVLVKLQTKHFYLFFSFSDRLDVAEATGFSHNAQEAMMPAALKANEKPPKRTSARKDSSLSSTDTRLSNEVPLRGNHALPHCAQLRFFFRD